MFDSHCHLQNESLAATVEQLIARAHTAGVSGMMLAGVAPADWMRQDALAARYPALCVSYGLHPHWIAQSSTDEVEHALAQLKSRLSTTPPTAVGEIGLDGGDQARRSTLDYQGVVFRQQLRWAKELNLPVLLHVVQAHARALALLKEEGLPARGGVLHSCSASSELAAQYLALGLHLSFAGPVTYERAKKVHALVKRVPKDRLLVETDSPDQAPAGRPRGQSEPSFLVDIVQRIAELRDESGLAEQTEANARRLFALA